MIKEVSKMRTLVNRYYYTLSDLADFLDIEHSYDSAPAPIDFFPRLAKSQSSSWAPVSANEVLIVWQQHIWPRFYLSDITYVDIETNPWTEPVEPDFEEDIKPSLTKKVGQIYAWLRESQERYIPIIQTLEEVKTRLLDQIESSAVSVYNDTPQVANDFENDPYATTSTRSKSKSEVATPIERFNEISKKMRSVYEDWADEFRRFVIFSA